MSDRNRVNKVAQLFLYIKKSKFVRSIFIRTIAVFIAVIFLVVTIVYLSFNTEINRTVTESRKKQLTDIENTISERMSEVISVAYNIGRDSTFLLEPVDSEKYSGYEMADRLSSYLVGNGFIKLLAYYKLSESDNVYTSVGKLSFYNFWKIYISGGKFSEKEYLEQIRSNTGAHLISHSADNSGHAYFSYVYPLPQFSANPRAFVIALIPLTEIESLLSSQLTNSYGKVALFDAGGNMIHEISSMDEEYELKPSGGNPYTESVVHRYGKRYVLQEQVSDVNGWSCVSFMRLGDIMNGLAGTQIIAIIAVIVLMIFAVWIILVGIVNKYKPISQLALTLTDESHHKQPSGAIDEKSLLTTTIATLKSDSEQKQKLEVAYQEATEASLAKSRFLSNMSHDIRTPMNAIIGMTNLAQKRIDDTAYVKNCLKKVDVASHYLLDIINNVLDMSRIESGKISLSEEVIDISRLVNNIITIVSTNVEEKRQRLIVEVDTINNKRVIGDGVRLTQICMNILSNAVKFTPYGGTITMNICETPSERKDCSNYIFTFTDTGIGMSEAFVSRVFDSFSRAQESGISGIEGTGLGMAIAKNLVALMGGSIECRSIQEVGTTFTVTLPMMHARNDDKNDLPYNERETEVNDGKIDFSGKRVLLVEDNDMNREIAKTLISETNADVVEAVNGQQAIDIFASNDIGYFDLILMDIQMPVLDGYSATMIIRAMNRTDASIPIYAMTADTFDEDVCTAKEVGMNGHLGKPYLPEELYRILRITFSQNS